ncbi:uncharacterized protein [Amphiura filiformis]|uniref:uncharacterized protein n=1 Tax=Amphiura filiformis TaxID=82378 RepID=UPI003B21890F
MILVIIRQFLVSRGSCAECAPCGKEDGRMGCCDCWIAFAESCNCCAYPNMRTCLDSLCGPPDNRCSMEKCLNCQTCQGQGMCGEATGCECAGCDCACQNPECENIDCLCFKISLH